jgi:hypothetical protein
VKIVIAGETFDYDNARRPLSEALAIEKAWGRRYAEWEAELMGGSAEATAVLVWVVYRREGRDVPLADILEGTVDFDYGELVESLAKAWVEAQAAAEAAKQDPTSGAAPLTVPDGTGTTSAATSERSPRSSASARGKSGS